MTQERAALAASVAEEGRKEAREEVDHDDPDAVEEAAMLEGRAWVGCAAVVGCV